MIAGLFPLTFVGVAVGSVIWAQSGGATTVTIALTMHVRACDLHNPSMPCMATCTTLCVFCSSPTLNTENTLKHTQKLTPLITHAQTAGQMQRSENQLEACWTAVQVLASSGLHQTYLGTQQNWPLQKHALTQACGRQRSQLMHEKCTTHPCAATFCFQQVGLAAALECAKAGKSVAVLERFTLFNASGSSGDFVRMFRVMYTEDYLADLALQAKGHWEALEEESGKELVLWSGGLRASPPATRGPAPALLQNRKRPSGYGIHPVMAAQSLGVGIGDFSEAQSLQKAGLLTHCLCTRLMTEW